MPKPCTTPSSTDPPILLKSNTQSPLLNRIRIISIVCELVTQFINDMLRDDLLEELTLDFYHSLALPEYTFPYAPADIKALPLETTEQLDSYGVKYLGEFYQGKPHGNGVMMSNTVKYMGQWRDGMKDGAGREIRKRQVYEGEFHKDKREGNGMRYTEDRVQNGVFKNGRLVSGQITYKNGDKYKGELDQGKYHCQNGHLQIAATKLVYSPAQFVHGHLASATIEYPNGSTYKGSIERGLKHGRGKFIWPGGSTWYDGEYKWDVKHGKGDICIDGKLKRNATFDGGVLIEESQSQQEPSYSQLPNDWI